MACAASPEIPEAARTSEAACRRIGVRVRGAPQARVHLRSRSDAMRTERSDATPDPGIFPLVPMRNLVLFPDVLMPVSVGRPRSVAAIDHALRTQSMLVLVLQRDAQDDAPQLEGLHAVGTLARIVRDLGAQDGLRHLVCQGVGRVRIEQLEPSEAYMAVRVSPLSPTESLTTQVEALGLQVRERAAEVLSLLPGVPAEIVHTLQSTRGPSELADLTASLIDVDLAQKQQLLETVEIDARLQKVLQMLTHRIEVLKLSQEIGELTKANLSDRERKYLLREQVRTIQKELGEAGDDQAEVAEIDAAIAQADMPAEVEAHARKELERLERIGTGSPEYGMLHTYLDWMTGLPWRLQDEAAIDLDAAQRVLEADHFGLKSVKQRIIEFLAVQKLNPNGRAPILCFVGPPGVG
jgi:ATP-dependent Lon protease